MFQAEYGKPEQEVMLRSAASNDKTVRFTEDGQFVYWQFKTPTCALDILDIIYSNDGQSDNITVWIDDKYVDEFETLHRNKEGVYWNEMLESGPLGSTKALIAGNHTLNLTVSSVDVHGVEIDDVRVGVMCNDIEACCDLVVIYDQSVPTQDSLPKQTIDIIVVIEILSIMTACILLIMAVLGVLYTYRKKATANRNIVRFISVNNNEAKENLVQNDFSKQYRCTNIIAATCTCILPTILYEYNTTNY